MLLKAANLRPLGPAARGRWFRAFLPPWSRDPPPSAGGTRGEKRGRGAPGMKSGMKGGMRAHPLAAALVALLVALAVGAAGNLALAVWRFDVALYG